jgi:ATP-dependent DNA helicase RecQ
VLRLGHDKLSTYGIIKNYSLKELQTYVRQLIQQGYLTSTQDQYSVVKLNAKSNDVLKGSAKVFLYKIKKLEGEVEESVRVKNYDEKLFQNLRVLRKKLADKQNVPPYIIFSDASLREMSTYFPENIEQFRDIKGVGDQKIKNYGEAFVSEIKEYCEKNGISSKPVLRKVQSVKEGSTIDATIYLYEQGKSVQEIAKERGFGVGTIYTHLESAYLRGDNIEIKHLVSEEKFREIEKVVNQVGRQALNPIKAKLGDKYSYDEIRIVRAVLIRADETNG